MEVIAMRGDSYLIKCNEEYFLVDMLSKKVYVAAPPNVPDMFTKWGYFEDVEVSPELEQEIFTVYKNRTR